MLPDRVSNPGPLTYESGVLPIALRGPALDGFDSIIYANYYLYFNGNKQDYYSNLVLTTVC